MEWADLLNLCNDGAARRHFEALFRLLPERNYTLYAYNITNNRYEYLDGRVLDMCMRPGEISKQSLVSNHYALNTFYYPFNILILASVTEKEA